MCYGLFKYLDSHNDESSLEVQNHRPTVTRHLASLCGLGILKFQGSKVDSTFRWVWLLWACRPRETSGRLGLRVLGPRAVDLLRRLQCSVCDNGSKHNSYTGVQVWLRTPMSLAELCCRLL